MNAFTTPITVRFRDIDSMGHVNNAVYFTYFEEGRKTFFSSFSKEKKVSFNFILARISCDYLRPVSLETPLMLEMRVKETGTKSFVLSYRLRDPDDGAIVYANGESVQVWYDYQENRSVNVPDDMRHKLLQYTGNDSA